MLSCKRVGVIGSRGQLGTDIVRRLSEEDDFDVVELPHERLDVSSVTQVRAVLEGERFDVVINCAAFHRVDECEDRVADSFRINAEGPHLVARACAALGAACVFISTDYVFAGDKGAPYDESDRVRPVNVYGVSKAAGEMLVQEACERWMIFRIASVFGSAGSRGKGGNFIEAILKNARAGGPVKVVNDSWISPTYTVDAADALRGLIRAGAVGVFHGSNTGRCSWFDLAQEAVRLVGLETPVTPIGSAGLAARARRPRDSSMSSVRMEEVLGKATRPWQEALRAYLVEKAYIAS